MFQINGCTTHRSPGMEKNIWAGKFTFGSRDVTRRRTDRKEWRNQKTHFCSFLALTPPNSHTVNGYCCRLLLTEGHSKYYVGRLTVHLLYKYCTNCTACNWTVLTAITQKLLLHVQLHNNTAHLLYKYCTNCTVCNWTYSNYTESAATCSAAQQHSTFTVQILYKLYSLQLNCTYSNYTVAAATCSATQEHSTFTVQILYKLYSPQLNCTYSNYT